MSPYSENQQHGHCQRPLARHVLIIIPRHQQQRASSDGWIERSRHVGHQDAMLVIFGGRATLHMSPFGRLDFKEKVKVPEPRNGTPDIESEWINRCRTYRPSYLCSHMSRATCASKSGEEPLVVRADVELGAIIGRNGYTLVHPVDVLLARAIHSHATTSTSSKLSNRLWPTIGCRPNVSHTCEEVGRANRARSSLLPNVEWLSGRYMNHCWAVLHGIMYPEHTAARRLVGEQIFSSS